MLDTLKTVPKFKRLYNLVSILGSGYIEFDKINFDYGPIFLRWVTNEVEGIRLRAWPNLFCPNDPWRFRFTVPMALTTTNSNTAFRGNG
jgi:hypothetical protein